MLARVGPVLGAVVALLLLVALVVERGLRLSGGYLVYGADDAYLDLAVARQLATDGSWGLGTGFVPTPMGWTAMLAAAMAGLGPREVLPAVLGLVLAIAVLVVVDRAWQRERLEPAARGVALGIVALGGGLAASVVRGDGAVLAALAVLIWVGAVLTAYRRRGLATALWSGLAGALAGAVTCDVAWLALPLVLGLVWVRRRRLALFNALGAAAGVGAGLALPLAHGWPPPMAAVGVGEAVVRALAEPHLVALAVAVPLLAARGRPDRARFVVAGGFVGAMVLHLLTTSSLGVPLTVLGLAVVVASLLTRPRYGQGPVPLGVGVAAIGLVVLWGASGLVATSAGVAASWRTEGQVARLLAEELPEAAVVWPVGLPAWRSPAPVAELGCRGSRAAAWACRRSGWTPKLGAGVASRLGARVAVVADRPGVGVPPGWHQVDRWVGEGLADVRVFALTADSAAVHRAVVAFDGHLDRRRRRSGEQVAVRAVSVSDAAPERPRVGACGAVSAPLLDLGAEGLTTSAGTVWAGQLVRRDTDVAIEVAPTPGTWRLELWASVSVFDESPAELRVQLGGSELGVIALREGAARRYTLGFEVAAPVHATLRLSLLNDARGGGRDRNIYLQALRLTRTEMADPGPRAEALRAALRGTSVVLISVDTLRADHLSASGYPRATSPVIDGLAAGGARFDDAIAASHWTAPSHASMLTGLHPPEHGVGSYPRPETLGAGVTTLAEVLRDAGWATGGFVDGVYVSAAVGLSQGFGHWEEGAALAKQRFGGAAGWIEAQPAGVEVFAFVHTYQVHEPYDPPPPYDRWFMPDFEEDAARVLRLPNRETVFATGFRPTLAQRAFQVALYDGEIRYTDQALRPLLDALARTGRGDALVVLTSDHGEEFYEHGSIGHGQMFAEQLRIPLILSHPALPGLAEPVVHQVVGTVDLMPTLLDLVGVAAPEVSGHSLVPALAGACDPQAQALSTSRMFGERKLSLVDGSWHYLQGARGEHLFDVVADRAERHDLAAAEPERLVALREAAQAWAGRLVARPVDPPAALDDEELRRLQELGYLE